MLQQAGRLAHEYQPKDIREPSRRGDAQAWRPQHRGSGSQGAAAAGLIFPKLMLRCAARAQPRSVDGPEAGRPAGAFQTKHALGLDPWMELRLASRDASNRESGAPD